MVDKIIEFKKGKDTPSDKVEAETVYSYAESVLHQQGYDDVIIIGVRDGEDGEFDMEILSNIEDNQAIVGTIGIAITQITLDGI